MRSDNRLLELGLFILVGFLSVNSTLRMVMSKFKVLPDIEKTLQTRTFVQFLETLQIIRNYSTIIILSNRMVFVKTVVFNF